MLEGLNQLVKKGEHKDVWIRGMIIVDGDIMEVTRVGKNQVMAIIGRDVIIEVTRIGYECDDGN